MRLSVLLFLFSAMAHAGQVFIYVSDGKPCDAASESELSIFRLTSEQTIHELSDYFISKSQNALLSAAIVNSGIKFCSETEQHKVFEMMLNELAKPKPSQPTWEVLRNYHRMRIFKEEFNKRRRNPNKGKHESTNLAKVEGWY